MVAFEHGLDHCWPFCPLSAAVFAFEIGYGFCIPCCPSLFVAVAGVAVLVNPKTLNLLHSLLLFGYPSHT